MSAIRVCDEHGYFDDRESCPVCESGGDLVLAGDRRRRLSKFLSGALRHFPDDVGLDLDDAGWTPFGDLLAAVETKYDWAEPEHVVAVVATDPKGRFELSGGDGRGAPPTDGAPTDGVAADADATDADPTDDEPTRRPDRVRAAYGHSVDVDLESAPTPVPDTLYHGTAPRNLDAIRSEGLQPMDRQLVHLSGTVEEARAVGSRHTSDPIVLEIDAAAMLDDGHEITKRGRGIYTTEEVPPAYVSEYEG